MSSINTESTSAQTQNNAARNDSNNNGAANVPQPPVAKRIPKVTEIHGKKLTDDYFWMREKSNPEVISYLEAENRYTDQLMRPTEAFQKSLYDEMLARIKQTDVNVPFLKDGYYYFSRTEEGKQYPILARKKGDLKAPEKITLDMNKMAEGLKYFAIGAYEISDDTNILAFSTDTTGYRQYTLQFKDLRTGQMLPDKIEKTISVVWAADNKTIFYTKEDAAKRPATLWRHTLGTDASKDQLVYEEKDELYRVGINRSRSDEYIFLTVASSETSEVRYMKASEPTGEWKLVSPRKDDHEYYVDHRADKFYIRTNSNGANNFRVATAPVSDPKMENWTELVAQRKGVKIEDIDLFADYLLVTTRNNGLDVFDVYDFKSKQTHAISFPEQVYAASGSVNAEFNTELFRFNYQSFTTSSSVFDYNMRTRQSEKKKQTKVLGGYNASDYQSERIFATAKDGTKIPISLVYKKGIKRDGTNPVLLYGYGSYGYALPDTFSSARLSLLNRGVVYAVAHIRGGGELGEEWRDAGKMFQKMNTFTDFIASAEHLIKEKYTGKDRLIIQGGSAGGLLVGAVTNLRPDLFKAVVAQVPFVDVVNTMLDASLPLTVQEYLEWGNPNTKKEFDYIYAYSPYDQVRRAKYPNMLVKVSVNDSQVPYWEGAKLVAKLRTHNTGNSTILLKTNMGAGHGGASGRYDALREVAFDYAYMIGQFGITK